MVTHVLSEIGEGWDGRGASLMRGRYLNVAERGPGGDKKEKLDDIRNSMNGRCVYTYLGLTNGSAILIGL